MLPSKNILEKSYNLAVFLSTVYMISYSSFIAAFVLFATIIYSSIKMTIVSIFLRRLGCYTIFEYGFIKFLNL